MNTGMLGKAMLLTWAELGVKVIKVDETQESITMYISVPERGYQKNKDEVEMAGRFLVKRIKETLAEMGMKRLTLKYKIRENDYWNKDKAEEAKLEMKKYLYGSQY